MNWFNTYIQLTIGVVIAANFLWVLNLVIECIYRIKKWLNDQPIEIGEHWLSTKYDFYEWSDVENSWMRCDDFFCLSYTDMFWRGVVGYGFLILNISAMLWPLTCVLLFTIIILLIARQSRRKKEEKRRQELQNKKIEQRIKTER